MGVLTDIGMPLLLTLEIFLMFASYYIGPLSIQVFLIVLMLLLGRETGAAILYWLSRLVGDPFIAWLERHFPWLFKRIPRIKSRLQKKVTLMVTLVRLTPGFLQVPSVVAGSLKISFIRFLAGVAVSSLIYDFGLVLFGFIARQVVGDLSGSVQDYFVVGFIIIIILMWLVIFLFFRHSLLFAGISGTRSQSHAIFNIIFKYSSSSSFR